MNKINLKWDFPYTKSNPFRRQFCNSALKHALLLLSLAATLMPTSLWANSGGVTGFSREDNTCNTCHQGAFFNSVVRIEGEDEVAPGSLNEFVINMSHDGNQGGFNMSLTDGTFIAGEGMSRLGREMTHNRPQNVSGGANTWTFQWQAPEEAGNESLFLCANAVNGNGQNSGDETNTACTIFRITVATLNDAPVASNDTASVDEDNSVTISVLSNDSDADGSLDSSSVTIVSGVTSGSTSITSGGAVSYTPDSNFNGSDSFTYTVADNEGSVSNEATVTITVNSVNDIPVASDDSASTSEDTSITINVLANDSDVEDSLSGSNIFIESGPDNGAAQVVGNNVSYTPEDNFSGSDNFTYVINDSDGGTSQPATVSITVVAVNDAPVAEDDSANTDEDTTVTIDILANDSDSDGSLDSESVEIVSQGSNGSVTVSAGSAIYTPDADFNGSDSFTYRVSDNEGSASNTATVSVTVNSVNDAPIANDDVQGTNLDTPVAIAVLDNDSDDGSLDVASIQIVSTPSSGGVSANSDGTITYSPDAGFIGQDSFIYTVNDDDGVTSNEATVSVTVRVNEAPVANADSAQTNEDEAVQISVLANDTDDIEIDTASVEIVAEPENGTATVGSNGVINFQPAQDFFGEDSFSYQVSDFENGTSEPATVSVSIAAVNDTPEFTSEPALTLVQGQNYSYEITVTDVDSEDLTVSLTESPDWLSLDGLILTGVPPLSAIGENAVVLQVSDGDANNEQSFSILVTERTDADLSIAVDTSSAAGVSGEAFVYQLTVSSNGPADASDVSLSAAWQGVDGSLSVPDNCSADGLSMTCVLDLVTPESPVTLEVSLIADTFGDLITNAEVDFAEENNGSNNDVQIARSIASNLIQPVNLLDDSGLAAVSVADINGDGFMDMARTGANRNELVVALNNGRGQLIVNNTKVLEAQISLLQFAELDGDTEQELLLVLDNSTLLMMDAADGVNFTESSRMTLGNVSDLVVADLNNDGNNDIAVASSTGSNLVLQNQGDMSFMEESLGNDNSLAVAALDINADMYPDLVFANGDNANSFYLNLNMMILDGLSWFDSGSSMKAENSQDVTAVDVDGDMQYEVLFANSGVAGNSLYQSEEGEFQQVATLGLAATDEALMADLNADGASDLLFVQQSGVVQQWLNDGAGAMSLSGEALLIEDGSGYAVADFDDDGVSDIAVAASSESIIFNDGMNNFAAASADLSVTAQVSADVLSVGDSWTLTVSASNNSSDFDALNSVMTLTVPALLGASSPADGCVLTDEVWTCDLGTLEASDSTTITVEGVIADGANGDFNISVQISSAVADPDRSNNSAEVSVLINAAPVANNDTVTVEHNGTAVIAVLGNDTDDIGLDSSSVTIVSGPANGSATVSSGGSITYTPTTDYAGSDSFTYSVSDSNGVVSNVATVSITVSEAPDDGGAVNQMLALIMLIMLLVRRKRVQGKPFRKEVS